MRRQDEPGRSQKDRSATSGPLIWSETQLFEKLSSDSSPSSSSPSKKCFRGFLGFRMARCARLIRPSTSALSVIRAPNGSFLACPRGWPFSSVMNRRETMHCQGLSLRERRHSVGHLGPRSNGNGLIKGRGYIPSASPSSTWQRDS